MFKMLTKKQLDILVHSLEVVNFDRGQIIMREGDPANEFYLIISGTVSILRDEREVRVLQPNEYFGERGLLFSEKRSATCSAGAEGCQVAKLGRDLFDRVVGSLRTHLERRITFQDIRLQLNDLRVKGEIGKGTFGTVRWVAPSKCPDDQLMQFALKSVPKHFVVENDEQQSIRRERDVLFQCDHPFICQLVATYQDERCVHFLLELLPGGDLFTAMREAGVVSNSQQRFLAASLVMVFEYLHGKNIIYRDLKPENVMLDQAGYFKLVDFGIANQAGRTYTLIGTPEYMAPEMILGRGYGSSVDWWGLGVVMFEIICGPLPFGEGCEDRLELFKQIVESPLSFPKYVQDAHTKDFLSSLLTRAPERRLGSGKNRTFADHKFFESFDWEALWRRKITSPWKPPTNNLLAESEESELLDEHLQAESIPLAPPDANMDWAKAF